MTPPEDEEAESPRSLSPIVKRRRNAGPQMSQQLKEPVRPRTILSDDSGDEQLPPPSRSQYIIEEAAHKGAYDRDISEESSTGCFKDIKHI